MPAPILPSRILPKITRLAAPHIPLAVYRRLLPRNPIGFFYHAVSDTPLPHIKHLYPIKSAAEFEQDILYLKQHYTLIGYPELCSLAESLTRRIADSPSIPSNAAFLSFDDGFVECTTVVRPLLLKHNIPCLFFLATDWMDNQAMYYRGKMSLAIEALAKLDPEQQNATLSRITPTARCTHRHNLQLSNLATFKSWLLSHQQADEPLIDRVCDLLEVDIPGFLRTRQPFLTRAQIQEMQAEGFVFGAHTRRHPKLSTISQGEQAAEIVESCQFVCEMTGQDQVPFAFPFSGSGVDRDFLARLRTEHPHIGPLFDTQKLRRDRPFIFQRIWADQPVPGVLPERNLAHWLRDAYIREMNRSYS